MKLFLLLLILAPGLKAQTSFFDIQTDQVTGTLTGPLRDEAIRLLEAMEVEGQAELDNIDPENYLKYSADSAIMAGKAISSDHANDFKYFMVGAGLGLGINTGNKSISDFISGDLESGDANGAGAQASVLIGLNLGVFQKKSKRKSKSIFNLAKFDLFLSYFAYDIEQDDFTADTSSAGIKLRWRLMGQKDLVKYGLLRWTGLKAQLGYQTNSLNMSLSKRLNISESSNDAGTNIEGTFNSNAIINADISTSSIPLEISSGIQFLYLFTFYGGAAFDLNSGSGKGSASLSDSTVRVESTSGVTAGQFLEAPASAFLGQEQDATSSFTRYFLGLQVNLWALKLGLQYDKSFSENTHGLSAGVKLAF